MSVNFFLKCGWLVVGIVSLVCILHQVGQGDPQYHSIDLVNETRQQEQREPAYLHMSITNLVASQTGNSDKENREQLCDGDRFIKWDDIELRDNDHLVKVWLASAGRTEVPITVERSFESESETLTVNYRLKSASELFAEGMKGGRSEYRQPEQIFPELESITDLTLKSVADEMLADTAPLADRRLAQAFKRLTDYVRGHYRSDHIVYLLNRPFHCEAWGRQNCDNIATATSISDTVARCWKLASPQARSLDLPDRQSESATSLEEWCRLIAARVDEINRFYQNALSELSADERSTFHQWCRSMEPKWRGDAGWDEFVVAFQLTKKINVEVLRHSVAKAAALSDEMSPGGKIFDALVALDAKPTESATIGTITIGSASDDVHNMTSPVTIDFGGNDQYIFPESGMDSVFPIRFIVDISGDDRYLGSANAIAAGVGGISVLIDAAGDDTYETRRNGLGFAVCGLGLLVDGGGHDHYRGRTFVQGAGCIGVGLIIDRDGNDHYHAASYSQSIGLPGGCGAIIDEAGDDNYHCTGVVGSPYGDQGEYEGMGQGCGFGFRYLGCGGIGLLMDKQGRDFYRAGQFGLACGYYYGIGLVNDRDGDDIFECSRYGLGSAAHYGVGLVMDDGGNDFYTATRLSAVAEMGSAWDLSLGALIDSGGNDIYRCEGYALGGAAQNAYGFLWDKSGDDTYISSKSAGAALGFIGGASYGAGRGARNLAIFLDEAGKDHYQTGGQENGKSGLHGEFGIWVDR